MWQFRPNKRFVTILCQQFAVKNVSSAKRQNVQHFMLKKNFTGQGQSEVKVNNRIWLYSGILAFFGLEDLFKETDEFEDPEEMLIHNIKLGILASMKGEYDKAENILHIALKMAFDLNNQDGVAYIYDVLANVAFDRGDYMKAERLFKDVVGRLVHEQGHDPADNKVIHISLKLAKVYSVWKQDDKAESGFEYCINAQDKKLKSGQADDDTLALWGMSRDWYAQHLLDRGKVKKAGDQFRIAHETCARIYGDDHPQSIVLLNSLGTTASLQNDHKEAIGHFERAVNLAKEAQDEDPNLPAYLVNLGMARIRLGTSRAGAAACFEAQAMLNSRLKKAKGDDEEAKESLKEAEECLKLSGQMGNLGIRAK